MSRLREDRLKNCNMMLKNSTKGKNITLITAVLPRIENNSLAIAKNVILVLSFSILTAISSKLKIEIGPIPITMQTLVVLLSGALLGKKRGTASQITYLFLGLIGLPWFSRGGGIAYVLSPTFGYILGFILAAYLVGALFEKGWGKNIISAFFVMLIGNYLIYIPGLLWLGNFIEPSRILIIGLYPFIFGDLLKIFLGGIILSFSWKTISKNNKVV